MHWNLGDNVPVIVQISYVETGTVFVPPILVAMHAFYTNFAFFLRIGFGLFGSRWI